MGSICQEYEHFRDVLQPISEDFCWFPQKSFIINRLDMLPSPPKVVQGKRSYNHSETLISTYNMQMAYIMIVLLAI